MKKRLLSSNSTESLISKFSKYDEDAGEIAKQCSDAQENASRVSMSGISRNHVSYLRPLLTNEWLDQVAKRLISQSSGCISQSITESAS